MITALRRVCKAGFVGFWRSAYVSFSSIFVITVALFVILAIMMVDQLLQATLNNIQSRVDINVYFTTTASEQAVTAFRSAVEALPEVTNVTFTTREEVLARYRALNQNNAITLQALDELQDNPFGATLAIQASETSQYEAINRFISEQREQDRAVSEIIYNVSYFDTKEAIDRLTSIIGAVERGSFYMLITLLASAILITFNTIRLAIYTAREEIAVMRLVGASNWFIRGPFMLQGAMYGLVATMLALLAIYPIVVWIGPQTANFFEFNLYVYFINEFRTIVTFIGAIGIGLGLVSSMLAIARYLKV